jgi:DnaA family protein
MLQLPLDIVLDDLAQFDNFFSSGNELLFSRLRAIDTTSENFIFVWGNSKSGKTHLAQALCHHYDQKNFSVVYIPLSNPHLMPEIISELGQIDLICLDDLEAVIGKSDWEKALFDLYNSIKQLNKHLVVFSRHSPSDLNIGLADLESRLMAMEIYKINQLNDAQKVDFIQYKAKSRGFDISDEVASFILSRLSRSLADLVSSIEKIDQQSMILKRKVTIPLIKEIFQI